MRPLTEPEPRAVLKKLANYAGPSLKNLLTPLDTPSKANHYVFRLSKSRVYYVRLSLANLATSVARKKLLSKFHLHITALPILAPIAQYKLWLRPNGVMPFLYGGNILKAYVPLGFGGAAKSMVAAQRLDPTGIMGFRQADCGEYLRDEESLFNSSG
ncbi:Pre-PUA domain-containing protein [Cenococcum geophilum 1.58]|uniref:Pre-PUA domain-containing protein n=1 Tax=Cenococcum geophilum 1.58 TaxID=794803 RepID=UPI00358E073D|nr:Pre-PUA domain-containing protein [Cenococcum geophilum 1.58]